MNSQFRYFRGTDFHPRSVGESLVSHVIESGYTGETKLVQPPMTDVVFATDKPILPVPGNNSDNAVIGGVETNMLNPEAETSLKFSDKVRGIFIGIYIVGKTGLEELRGGWEATNSRKEKAELGIVSVGVVGGQAYERGRVPEIIGAAVTTGIYKEIMTDPIVSNEYLNNLVLAPTISGLALGGLIYAQQKPIGKAWVKSPKHYPETYETVKQLWPKTVNAASGAIPNAGNRFSEGATMFGLGTTPFIISARILEPNIQESDLSVIEKRVTRRGSIYGVALASSILLAKSSSQYVKDVDVDTEIFNRDIKFNGVGAGKFLDTVSDKAIDIASSPLWIIGILGSWSAAKFVTNSLKERQKSTTKTV